MLTHSIKEKEIGVPTRISYSQFSTYVKCPYKWKLNYIDGYRDGGGSIHTLFGSAMHTVIQTWLHTLYTVSVKASNALDLCDMLEKEMVKEFLTAKEESGEELSSPKEMSDFYYHGVEILNYFRKKRLAYYSTANIELIGIETPLNVNVEEDYPGVVFTGYLDFIWHDKDHNTYHIDDFKTSTRGWNEAAKKDKSKSSQLVLYKEFYSKQFNVPVENVKVRFIILKRLLWENSDFPQKRIQIFEPTDGKVTRKKLREELREFIVKAFNPDGTYNTVTEHPAMADTQNCKYCEFKNRKDLCPSGVNSK